jgi:hypothetical protein
MFFLGWFPCWVFFEAWAAEQLEKWRMLTGNFRQALEAVFRPERGENMRKDESRKQTDEDLEVGLRGRVYSWKERESRKEL